jgi:hypothetical protein
MFADVEFVKTIRPTAALDPISLMYCSPFAQKTLAPFSEDFDSVDFCSVARPPNIVVAPLDDGSNSTKTIFVLSTT